MPHSAGPTIRSVVNPRSPPNQAGSMVAPTQTSSATPSVIIAKAVPDRRVVI